MAIHEILIAISIVIYFGMGVGVLMRFSRKLSKKDIFMILLLVPLFEIYGFIIWTKQFWHDLKKTKIVSPHIKREENIKTFPTDTSFKLDNISLNASKPPKTPNTNAEKIPNIAINSE